MSTIWKIIVSVAAGLLLAIVSLVVEWCIDRLRVPRRIRPLLSISIRIAIFTVILVPLLIWSGREQPRLSVFPTMIMGTYGQKSGLSMVGDFVGRNHDTIYLLVRQISGGSQTVGMEVWTVATEVVDINKDRAMWKARLKLSMLGGEVRPGDRYEVVGVMTNTPLIVGAQVHTTNLRQMKATLTEVLDITIVEVVDE